MDIILKYLPDLKQSQKEQMGALSALYQDWNAKINVISRRDIDQLYLHHVLHSLAIAKYTGFASGTKILDAGCGGGFPGIPLAIMYPDVDFHLVDSVRKKLTVVDAIATSLGLKNIRTTHSRVESLNEQYDFVMSRAVTSLDTLLSWTRKNIADTDLNGVPNGWIVLKGGDLKEQLLSIKNKAYYEVQSVAAYFEEPYFEEKHLIYIQGF